MDSWGLKRPEDIPRHSVFDDQEELGMLHSVGSKILPRLNHGPPHISLACWKGWVGYLEIGRKWNWMQLGGGMAARPWERHDCSTGLNDV